MLLEDQNKFDQQMKEYRDNLNSVGKEQENIKNPKKFTFLTENYKVLSYKEVSNNKVVEKNDENDVVDIKKLMRFGKNKNIQLDPNVDTEESKIKLLKGNLFCFIN